MTDGIERNQPAIFGSLSGVLSYTIIQDKDIMMSEFEVSLTES